MPSLADQKSTPYVRGSAPSVEPAFLVYPVVRVAYTDDIHEGDASEEQECNGDLIEHDWQQDRQGGKSRGIANQLSTVLVTL